MQTNTTSLSSFAYLAADLLSHLPGRAYPVGCARRDCGIRAAYVQVEFPQSEPPQGRLRLRAQQKSAYCAEHFPVRPKARRAAPVLETLEAAQSFVAAHAAAQERRREQYAIEQAIDEATRMATDGRIHRMSGYRGTMSERRDGQLVTLIGGVEEVVCCWYQGQHRIDHRHRGGVPVPQHEPDCGTPRRPPGYWDEQIARFVTAGKE